jgi:hypothetical protein
LGCCVRFGRAPPPGGTSTHRHRSSTAHRHVQFPFAPPAASSQHLQARPTRPAHTYAHTLNAVAAICKTQGHPHAVHPPHAPSPLLTSPGSTQPRQAWGGLQHAGCAPHHHTRPSHAPHQKQRESTRRGSPPRAPLASHRISRHHAPAPTGHRTRSTTRGRRQQGTHHPARKTRRPRVHS